VKLPVINGREAIPVRQIPFLVGWNPLAPDSLAHLFAGTHPIHKGWTLSSHRVDENGKLWPARAEWWWDWADMLDALSIRMQRAGAHESDWKRESIRLLPAGCIVWRDEFKAEYKRNFGRYKSFTIPAAYRLNPSPEDEVTLDELVEEFLAGTAGDDAWLEGEPEETAEVDAMDDLFDHGPTGQDKDVFEGLESFVHESSPGASITPEAVAPAPAGTGNPPPVNTGDIAHAFAGLKWDEVGWKKPLGSPPKWLSACRVSPGRRGVCDATWNPVSIGAALVHARHIAPKSVRGRFQTKPQLKPWLESWKDYEATHLSDV